jgi:hypothetical protein
MSIGNQMKLFKNTNALHRKDGVVQDEKGRLYYSYKVGQSEFLLKELTEATFDWISTKRWDLNTLFSRNEYAQLYYLIDEGFSYKIEPVKMRTVSHLFPKIGSYYEA